MVNINHTSRRLGGWYASDSQSQLQTSCGFRDQRASMGGAGRVGVGASDLESDAAHPRKSLSAKDRVARGYSNI